MSLQTKKRFKNIAKIVGGIIFALILFTNIKIALLDDQEISRGDISILGIEMSLFDATYATEGTGDQYIYCAAIGCSYLGNEFCGYATVHNTNGTVTTYWCVIYVVHGGCSPPTYC